jgi:hypothetical protein
MSCSPSAVTAVARRNRVFPRLEPSLPIAHRSLESPWKRKMPLKRSARSFTLQFVGRLKKLMSDLEPLVRIRRLHVKAGKVLEGRASRFWIRRAVHVHMRLGKRSGA